MSSATIDSIIYTFLETNATITGFDNSTAPSNWNLVILSTVLYSGNTYNIVRIGDFAFQNCTGLTSITIPDSVTSIGLNAFQGCTGLTNIVVNSYLSNIGSAFSGLNNANTSWTFDYIGAIPEGVCNGKTGVTSVTIGNQITSIGNNAFARCGLTSITIPDSVASIRDQAFFGCTLQSVTFSNQSTCALVGYNTFQDCVNLTNITLPSSITSIPGGTFAGCINLTSITILGEIQSIGQEAFARCGNLQNITIPNSVTTIGNSAFEGCSSLTSITIPNLVTIIGYRVFRGCIGLTTVTFNNESTCTEIGLDSFIGCSSLINITIPDLVTSIGSSAFNDCRSLTSITIPSSVTSIGQNAFLNCTGLTNIVINSYLYNLGSAFNGVNNFNTSWTFNYSGAIPNNVCINKTNIISVTIGNQITSIGESAFQGCTGLTSITISNSVTSINKWAFRGCIGLTSITIPSSVTTIGEAAFVHCTNLTRAIIPNTVTNIVGATFEHCSPSLVVDYNPTINDLPSDITWREFSIKLNSTNNIIFKGYFVTINSTQFIKLMYSENNLNTNILAPYTNDIYGNGHDWDIVNNKFGGWGTEVTSIPALDSVYNASRWSMWGDNLSYKNAANGNWVELPPNTVSYTFRQLTGHPSLPSSFPPLTTTINSVIYTLFQTERKASITGYNSNTVPANWILNVPIDVMYNGIIYNVTSIGNNAFSNCVSLLSIAMPYSIKTIGNNAFEGCIGITNLTIPQTVESIGDLAFSNCTSLISLTISDMIKNIGSNVFYNCSPELIVNYQPIINETFKWYNFKIKFNSNNNIILDAYFGILLETNFIKVIYNTNDTNGNNNLLAPYTYKDNGNSHKFTGTDFDSNGTNISSIPYLDAIYTEADRWQLSSNNSISYRNKNTKSWIALPGDTVTYTFTEIVPVTGTFYIPNKIYGQDISFDLNSTITNTNAVNGFTYFKQLTNAITITNNIVTINNPENNVRIFATPVGMPPYMGSLLTATFSIVMPIIKPSPSVGSFIIPNQVLSSQTYTILNPATESTGIWNYTSSDLNIATIIDNIITFVSAGIVKVTATLSEDENYSQKIIQTSFSISSDSPSNFVFLSTEAITNTLPVESLSSYNTDTVVLSNTLFDEQQIELLNPSSGTDNEKSINREIVVQSIFNIIPSATTISVPKELIYLPSDINVEEVTNVVLFKTTDSTPSNPVIVNAISNSEVVFCLLDSPGNTISFTGYEQYAGYVLNIIKEPNNSFIVQKNIDGYLEESFRAYKGTVVVYAGLKIVIGSVTAQNYTEPTPVFPVCFPAGTPVQTDQGSIAIEKINPKVNTIRNKNIVAITKTVTIEDKIVCIEKDSLGPNIPSQKTYISRNHELFYNKQMIKAKNLIGVVDGVYNKKYNGEILYNVLLDKHDKMIVNNLIVETLDPTNIIAKLYNSGYSIEERNIIITNINEGAKDYKKTFGKMH
jgi:hypothetical protein